jgi:ABC-2 type transport system permease protein
MSLWRLEWLRLVRTRRLIALIGVYLFFGFTGPVSARYLGTILHRVGTRGVHLEIPPATPTDGIAAFVSNASQIGLLVVVLVAASALAVDARREMSVFLRTRVTGSATLVLPAYTITVVAGGVCYALGALAAWYETAVLIGGVSPARMLVGIGYGLLFLAFAVAVVALVAALARGVLATVGFTLVILLGLAVLSGLGIAARYLPTALASALATLAGTGTITDPVPAALIALVLTAAALIGAVRLSDRREPAS